jgi:hypothetical protein
MKWSDNDLTDEEKDQRIAALGLNEEAAILYLFVGLDGCCDLVLDFSMIRFILNRFPSTDALVQVLRFLVYFPCEASRLDTLLTKAKKMRDLSISQFYILYQINKVQLLRQTSSISTAAAARVQELSAATRELTNSVRQFWTEPAVPLSYLRWISDQRTSLESRWREVMQEFPNSSTSHQEYARFLLECSADFHETAHVRMRMRHIEDGSYRAVDLCFVAFVRLYPQYLRMGVMTIRGTFMHQLGEDSQNSGKHAISADSTDDNYAAAAFLADSMISHAKLKIALEQSLKSSSPTSHVAILVVGIYVVLGQLVALTVGFALLFGTYDSTSNRVSFSRAVTRCRVSSDEALVLLILNWANVTHRNFPTFDSSKCWLTGARERLNYQDVAIQDIYEAQAYYRQFHDELSDWVGELSDDDWVVDAVVAADVPLVVCWNGVPNVQSNISMLPMLSYQFSMLASMTIVSFNWSDVYVSNNAWCACLATVDMLGNAIHKCRELVHEDYKATYGEYEENYRLASIVAPIVLFVLFAPAVPIVVYYVGYEMADLVQTLLETEETWKAEASQALSRDNESAVNPVAITGSACPLFLVLYALGSVFLVLGVAAFLTTALDACSSTATVVVQIEQWDFTSTTRLPQAYEACIHLLNAWFYESIGGKPEEAQDQKPPRASTWT